MGVVTFLKEKKMQKNLFATLMLKMYHCCFLFVSIVKTWDFSIKFIKSVFHSFFAHFVKIQRRSFSQLNNSFDKVFFSSFSRILKNLGEKYVCMSEEGRHFPMHEICHLHKIFDKNL